MPTPKYNAEQIVDEVFALYELHGDEDYIGEPVSQIEHMSQAAALAESEGNDDEVVLAAFFHDIGHLCVTENVASMGGVGNVNHEQLGADFLLAHGFSKRIANLVQGHVTAKRYLTYKDPTYFKKLSTASKTTLSFQGGPMSPQEAVEFDSQPDANLIIRMRCWDDEAKLQNVPVNNLLHLRQMAIKHLKQGL